MRIQISGQEAREAGEALGIELDDNGLLEVQARMVFRGGKLGGMINHIQTYIAPGATDKEAMAIADEMIFGWLVVPCGGDIWIIDAEAYPQAQAEQDRCIDAALNAMEVNNAV